MNFMAAECSEEELMNQVAACHPGKNQDGPREVVYMGEDVDRKYVVSRLSCYEKINDTLI